MTLPVPAVAGALPPGAVGLVFGDGSVVTLADDDPRSRALRAVAGELTRP